MSDVYYLQYLQFIVEKRGKKKLNKDQHDLIIGGMKCIEPVKVHCLNTVGRIHERCCLQIIITIIIITIIIIIIAIIIIKLKQ